MERSDLKFGHPADPCDEGILQAEGLGQFQGLLLPKSKCTTPAAEPESFLLVHLNANVIESLFDDLIDTMALKFANASDLLRHHTTVVHPAAQQP